MPTRQPLRNFPRRDSDVVSVQFMHSAGTVTKDDQASMYGKSRPVKESGFHRLLKKVSGHFFRRNDTVETDENLQPTLVLASDSQHSRVATSASQGPGRGSHMPRAAQSRRRARRDSISMSPPAAKRVALGGGSRPQPASSSSFRSKAAAPILPDKLPKPTSEEICEIKKYRCAAPTPMSTPAHGIACTKRESTSASVVASATVSATRPALKQLNGTMPAHKPVSTSTISPKAMPISKPTTASVSSSAISNSAPDASSTTTVGSTTATRVSNISKAAVSASEHAAREHTLRSRTVAGARSTVEAHLPVNTRVARVSKSQSTPKSPAAFIKRNKLRAHLLRSGPDAMIVTTPERHEISRQLEEITIDTARTTLNSPMPHTRLREVTSAAELEREMDEELKAAQSQTDAEQPADESEPMELATPTAASTKAASAQETTSTMVAPAQANAPTVATSTQTAVPATEAPTQPTTPTTIKVPTRAKLTASMSAPVPAITSTPRTSVLPPEFMTPDLSRYKHRPYRYLHLRYEHDPDAIQSTNADDTAEPLDPGCRPTVSADVLLKRKLAEKKAESSKPKPLTKITGLDISLYEEKRDGPEYDDRENSTFSEFDIYADEIFSFYRYMDKKLMAPSNYMAIQPEIRWGMRMAVVNWLVQLHQKLRMQPETLYLAVNVMDRFLSKKPITAKRLELVGISSLLVAAKYEETICPKPAYLSALIGGACTEEDIIKAERFIVSLLEFDMGWPGPLNFMRRLATVDDYDLGVRVIAKYFLELSLMYEHFIGVPSDMMAAAAYRLASAVANRPHWTEKHVQISGYTKTQLNPVCHWLIHIVVHPHHFYNATYVKYSSPKYLKVAPFVHTWFKERSQTKTPSNA